MKKTIINKIFEFISDLLIFIRNKLIELLSFIFDLFGYTLKKIISYLLIAYGFILFLVFFLAQPLGIALELITELEDSVIISIDVLAILQYFVLIFAISYPMIDDDKQKNKRKLVIEGKPFFSSDELKMVLFPFLLNIFLYYLLNSIIIQEFEVKYIPTWLSILIILVTVNYRKVETYKHEITQNLNKIVLILFSILWFISISYLPLYTVCFIISIVIIIQMKRGINPK